MSPDTADLVLYLITGVACVVWMIAFRCLWLLDHPKSSKVDDVDDRYDVSQEAHSVATKEDEPLVLASSANLQVVGHFEELSLRLARQIAQKLPAAQITSQSPQSIVLEPIRFGQWIGFARIDISLTPLGEERTENLPIGVAAALSGTEMGQVVVGDWPRGDHRGLYAHQDIGRQSSQPCRPLADRANGAGGSPPLASVSRGRVCQGSQDFRPNHRGIAGWHDYQSPVRRIDFGTNAEPLMSGSTSCDQWDRETLEVSHRPDAGATVLLIRRSVILLPSPHEENQR